MSSRFEFPATAFAWSSIQKSTDFMRIGSVWSALVKSGIRILKLGYKGSVAITCLSSSLSWQTKEWKQCFKAC